jgi:3-oxoacyl-[acyl-carrier-protein] synthase II
VWPDRAPRPDARPSGPEAGPPAARSAGPRHRVVVTGVGTVSALAIGDGAALETALAASRPAIAPIRAFSTEGCRSRLGAEVGDLGAHLEAVDGRRLARVSQLAVVAARLALADAGLEPGGVPALGLVLGSAYGDFRSSEEFARGYLARGPLGLSPVVFPNTVMNAMAAQAAIAVGAQGPMLTINQPGIAGELAVARGAYLVATGRAPTVLAGGVDELCPVLFHELGRLGVTSPRGAGPEGCWPFDRRANGTVAGEGATVVVLEGRERAEARGARIHGELRGAAWGSLPSPAHGFPPPGRRDPAIVRRALAMAALSPADVDAVYLSGTADPAQDACELDLVAQVFDAQRGARPWLTALTPLFGEHAGLGALRVAAATSVTLARGRVPLLPDLAQPVRDGLAFARTAEPDGRPMRTVLVHGLAPGGGHVALLWCRPDAVGSRAA